MNTYTNTQYIDSSIFETYLQTVQYLFNHDLICLFMNVNAVSYNWVAREHEGQLLQKQIVEWSEYTISGYTLKANQISVAPGLAFFIENGYRTDSQKQIAQAKTYMIISVIVAIMTFAGSVGFDLYRGVHQSTTIDSIDVDILRRFEHKPATIVLPPATVGTTVSHSDTTKN